MQALTADNVQRSGCSLLCLFLCQVFANAAAKPQACLTSRPTSPGAKVWDVDRLQLWKGGGRWERGCRGLSGVRWAYEV